MSSSSQPKRPQLPTTTRSPSSITLAITASMQAREVPDTGNVRSLRVWNTARASAMTSFITAVKRGSNWPSSARACAWSTRGSALLGPGPNSRQGGGSNDSIMGVPRTHQALDERHDLEQHDAQQAEQHQGAEREGRVRLGHGDEHQVAEPGVGADELADDCAHDGEADGHLERGEEVRQRGREADLEEDPQAIVGEAVREIQQLARDELEPLRRVHHHGEEGDQRGDDDLGQLAVADPDED